MSAPEPGWITEVDYVRAVDGDTIEVEIRRRFKVRIQDIDIVESNSERGQEATEYVDDKLSKAREIIVKIPTNSPLNLMDVNSFERIVGEIYVNGRKLSTMLKRAGYEKTRSSTEGIF
jgi:endonuclease YncB( thermonuclease family)